MYQRKCTHSSQFLVTTASSSPQAPSPPQNNSLAGSQRMCHPLQCVDKGAGKVVGRVDLVFFLVGGRGWGLGLRGEG